LQIEKKTSKTRKRKRKKNDQTWQAKTQNKTFKPADFFNAPFFYLFRVVFTLEEKYVYIRPALPIRPYRVIIPPRAYYPQVNVDLITRI
jgi:hypothetical protein